MINKSIYKGIAVFIFFMGAITCVAQKGGTFQKSLFVQDGDTLKYQIMYPINYDESKQYPLILFLHGAGERGNDNERQMKLGSHIFRDKENQKDYPAIVLFPQCSKDVMWTNRRKFKKPDRMVFEFPVSAPAPRPSQLVNALVEQFVANKKVNADRMYVMGISMGGIGALEYLYRWSDKYAAAYIVCGGHNDDLARYYANVPIWFAHGDKDQVVPIDYSRSVYEKLSPLNQNTRFKIYPGMGHSIWTPAFEEKDLLYWLFQFSKSVN
ncbi:prolyl oligopeptidase family serine peptidase [Marinifilum sp. N1E240]|uniref:carboxylesterase family protein n=1 Tax=Marinifilum sp. N1E240 TaxID=2608082 RepID=UPI00128DBC8A|nr:prolyl oligopeptidase family serine peptidase [Marinifilum sp. N1E240]MPQ47446.1 prolyl oligopeptidase family serine peptidase [Marinifilum sp. N1E240]